MKLIVGLGNPGPQYASTRHNIGRIVLDKFIQNFLENPSFTKRHDRKEEKKRNSAIILTSNVIFLKPLTYMNKSGQAVKAIAQFYKIVPEDILVLHDEIDFIPGRVEIKQGGSHAGHNGLRSMIEHLGTNTFTRVRIGVGRPALKEQVADYVLSSFIPSEFHLIEEKYPYIEQQLKKFIEK